jgi:nucleotide-binding universal stress UspA family protein
MKQILVPCDFSGPSIEGFKMAVDIASKSDGSITVLHAISLPSISDPIVSGEPIVYSQAFFSAVEEDVKNAYAAMVQRYGKSAKVNLDIEGGGLFEVVKSITEKRHVDLIVMGTTGTTGATRTLIGSNTEKAVRFSRVPVLAVRKASDINSIKNILLPETGDFNHTDFISKVKILQEFLKAKLHILLVNTPVNFKRDDEGKETLEEFAKHYQLENYVLHFQSYRNEEEGILDFSSSNKMDLIAMATHSRRGLSHLLSGSITENVVNHGRIPVWTYSIRK